MRESLLEFHKKWYSSNLMTLCIINDQPLEKLESLVKELFSLIINKNVVLPSLQYPLCFD
jgi:insulysin